MKSLIILLVAMLLTGTCAWPQASTGTVSGTVHDQSGAVIPNAQVVITSTGTNVSVPSRTNEAGRYYFPGITPGSYKISVDSPGMKKYEAAFTVQVQQSVVIDPVLKPGATTTVVEVTDVTPMVAVDSATVGHVLERQRVEQLPIGRRDLKVLLAVMPEIENVRAFGAPEGSMEFVLDGAPTINRRWGNHATMQGMLDSIQEFKVETNASSAKYSRPATVVMSTKSGTNQFHGSAFETHRNSGFGVARKREQSNAKPPQLIRNEFGLSAGGPVYLPKIYDGRNRTFWFVGWEATRTVQGTNQNFGGAHHGHASGRFQRPEVVRRHHARPVRSVDHGIEREQLRPACLSATAGCSTRFPISRLSPLAKYLYSITPAPTTADNPLVASNWYGVFRNRSRGYNLSTRIDHHFSDTGPDLRPLLAERQQQPQPIQQHDHAQRRDGLDARRGADQDPVGQLRAHHLAHVVQ